MPKYLSVFILLLFTSCQSKEHYKTETTNPYYLKLEKACNGSSCCLASLEGMVESNATLVPKSATCPKGFHGVMMKCIDAYSWCKKDSSYPN